MRSSLSKLLRAYTAGDAVWFLKLSLALLQGSRSFGRVAQCAEQYPRCACALPPPSRQAHVRQIADWRSCASSFDSFGRKFLLFFAQPLLLLRKIDQASQRNSHFRADRVSIARAEARGASSLLPTDTLEARSEPS